jgi:hypothetical protein
MLSIPNFAMIAEVVPINAQWKQSCPEKGNNLFAAKYKLGINSCCSGFIPSFPFLNTAILTDCKIRLVILQKLSREFLKV